MKPEFYGTVQCTDGFGLSGMSGTFVGAPKVSPLDDIVRKIEQTRIKVNSLHATASRVSDALLGSAPEKEGVCAGPSVGGRPGLVGHLNDQCDMLGEAINGLEAALSRLGVFG